MRYLACIIGTLWLSCSFSQELLPIKENGKWGFIDTSGQIVITPQYNGASNFEYGCAQVEIDGKIGLINAKGFEIVPIEYSNIFIVNDRICLRVKDTVMDVFNLTTKVSSGFKYSNFHMESPQQQFITVINSDSLEGVVNFEALEVLPCIYSLILPLPSSPYFVAHSESIKSVVDRSGALLFSDHFNSIKFLPEHDVFSTLETPLLKLRNKQGSVIVKGKYSEFKFLESAYVVLYPQKNFGVNPDVYIMEENKLLKDLEYEDYFPYSENWVSMTKNNMSGLLDMRNQKEILPPLFEGIGPDYKSVFPVFSEGKWFLVGEGGKRKSKGNYDYIGPFEDHLAVCKHSGKLGVLHSSGKESVIPKYQNVVHKNGNFKCFYSADSIELISVSRQGRILESDLYGDVKTIDLGGARQYGDNLVSGNNRINKTFKDFSWVFHQKYHKWSLIRNSDGQMVIGPIYDHIVVYPSLGLTLVSSERFVWDRERNIYGLVDHNSGKTIAKQVYKKIHMNELSDPGSYFLARANRINGGWDLIDRQGKYSLINVPFIDKCSGGFFRYCYEGKPATAPADSPLKVKSFIEYLVNDVGENNLSNKYVRNKSLIIKRGKWSYFKPGTNISGEFTFAHNFVNDQAIVKTISGWSVINKKGSFIFNMANSELELFDTTSGVNHYLTKINQTSTGILGKNKEVILEAEFQDIDNYSEGLIPVKKDNLWAYYDSNGNLVIEHQFSKAQPFSEGVALVRNKERKYHYIDKFGAKISTLETRRAYSYHGGLASVSDKGYYRLIDKSGEFVGEVKFTKEIEVFNDYRIVEFSGKQGLINSEGNWIIKPVYQKLNFDSPSNLLMAKRRGRWNLLTLEGKPVNKVKYKYINPSSDGMMAVFKNRKWGYVNETGKKSVDFKYKYAGEYNEGLAPVSDGKTWMYIDIEGNPKIQGAYSKLTGFSENTAVVRQKSKYGAINRNGEEVIPCEYRRLQEKSSGVFLASRKRGLWFYLNEDGEKLFNQGFERAEPFNGEYAHVMRDGKWGIITKKGHWVIPPMFSALIELKDGKTLIQTNSAYGLYDQKGTEIVVPKYTAIENMGNNIIKITNSGGLVYYNLKGYWVWNPNLKNKGELCGNHQGSGSD